MPSPDRLDLGVASRNETKIGRVRAACHKLALFQTLVKHVEAAKSTLQVARMCNCTGTPRNYTGFMEQKARVHLHEACVVPYRHSDSGVEFCLVTPVAENRWEFPKIAIETDARPDQLLGRAADIAGLRGHLQAEEPLGQFASSRGNEVREMVVFLMEVSHVDETWPLQDSHRRRWCLTEEARVRIRRKPLRGFIDAALRCLDPANGQAPQARRA